MFHESVIAMNATMVVYGILFGGVHPSYFCLYFIKITFPLQRSSKG